MKSGRFDLSGSRALVVGASRGIGRACALGLADSGADVALAGREEGSLADVAAAIRGLGREASTYHVDVRSVASIRAMVEAVEDGQRAIDILVYNAGTNVQRAALDVTEADWDLVMETNLRGAFFCAQAVGRGMVARGRGRIVNIGSTFAVVGFPNRAAYAASKGGLLQVTRVLAIEWARNGVTVNAVGPTATRTQMNEALFEDPDWRAQILPRIPAGRFGEPEDVVGAVIFLASPSAAMVTGQILLVDGGWTAI